MRGPRQAASWCASGLPFPQRLSAYGTISISLGLGVRDLSAAHAHFHAPAALHVARSGLLGSRLVYYSGAVLGRVRGLLFTGALAAVLGASGLAGAAPTDADKARARALLNQGYDLMEQGDP